jgi:hypothetical protein
MGNYEKLQAWYDNHHQQPGWSDQPGLGTDTVTSTADQAVGSEALGAESQETSEPEAITSMGQPSDLQSWYDSRRGKPQGAR